MTDETIQAIRRVLLWIMVVLWPLLLLRYGKQLADISTVGEPLGRRDVGVVLISLSGFVSARLLHALGY